MNDKLFIKKMNDCKQWLEKLSEADNASPVLLTSLLDPQLDKIKIGYNIAHFTLQVGSRTPRIKFLTSTETIFILEGCAEVEVNGALYHLREMELIFIPRHSIRCVINQENMPIKFLSIAEPAFNPEEIELQEEVEIL